MKNRFETFSGSIIELGRCLQKLKEIEMARFGLRAGHGMCLYYLGCHPQGLTVGQLTELCREDKAAISRRLSQLAEQGLTRSDPTENKRAYRTLHYLTDQGKKIADQLNARIAAALTDGGSGLSDDQRELFYTSLEQILCNLSQYIEKEQAR